MNPKNDKLFNASLLALLAIYAVLTQIAQFPGGIAVPSINPSFAGHTSTEVSGYTIVVTSLEGESLDAPRTLDAVLVDEIPSSVKSLVNRLGIAYYAEEWVEVDSLRAELEQALVKSGVDSAEYQLILRIVNPVEKYNWDSNVSEEVMMTFTY